MDDLHHQLVHWATIAPEQNSIVEAETGRSMTYSHCLSASDASFGISLVHVFILTALLQWVVPSMPAAWPVAFRVFLTWFLTAGGAAGISILLMRTPVLSHLVGRSAHWGSSWQANALHEWFSKPFHHPRKVEQKGSGPIDNTSFS
jgi:hypothetical protein